MLFFLVFCAAFALTWSMDACARSRGVLFERGVTLVGGVAVASALVLVFMCGRFFSNPGFGRIEVIGSWSLAVLIFGLWDDWKSSSVLQKFFWQFICAAGLVASGISTHVPFLGDVGNLLFSFVWIVGLTNALNLLDVSDGVCSGAVLASCAGMALLAFHAGTMDIFFAASGLGAGVAGFLFFNIPPAKVYLGNAGSHFAGFLLAALSLSLVGDASRLSMGIGVLMVFWLPILETCCLIFFRLKKRISPFNKTNDHLALRFAACRLTRLQVWGAMSALAVFFALVGVLVERFFSVGLTFMIFLALGGVTIVTVGLLFMMEEHGA